MTEMTININMRNDSLVPVIKRFINSIKGSTAIAYGYTMVTENVRHFEVQEGIKVENWVKR